jgi:hypothetical protein
MFISTLFQEKQQGSGRAFESTPALPQRFLHIFIFLFSEGQWLENTI